MTLGGVLAAALPPAPAAVAARVQPTQLAPHLQLLAGAGGNVTLLQAAEGPLLVDGGAAEHSAELLRAVRAQGDARPVKILFNTHWHPEQTGSNTTLGRAGARIIAHENTRLWLGTQLDSAWQHRRFAPLPPAGLPNDTFYTHGTLAWGGERIDYGHLLQAHTDGDIYVYFRDSNVLAVGDLLAVGSFPILDYETLGWIGGMVAANKALLELCDAQTRIVPGQGPVQTRADLQAQQDMLLVLRDRLFALVKQGLSAEEMIAAAPAREYRRAAAARISSSAARPAAWRSMRARSPGSCRRSRRVQILRQQRIWLLCLGAALLLAAAATAEPLPFSTRTA